MPNNTDVTNLRINTLTEAQYDAAVQQGIIGANELSFLTDISDSIQVDTLPIASVSEEGKIYQFIGTTDANYTNGYFYKCTSTGDLSTAIISCNSYLITNLAIDIPTFETQISSSGTYSFIYDEDENTWTDSNFDPLNIADYGITYEGTPSGTDEITVVYTAGNLTYSWERVDVQPSSSIPSNAIVDGVNKVNDGITLWKSGAFEAALLKLGCASSVSATSPDSTISISSNSVGDYLRIYNTNNPLGPMELGVDSVTPGQGYVKTLGKSDNEFTSWNNVYTKKINAGSGAGDITIPTPTGTMAVQVFSLPTAAAILEGQIYQYIGATDSTYTNGRFYKCVSDGQSTPTYSWEEVSMGGGSSSITVTLTAAGWSNDEQTVNATGVTASNSVFIGAAPASITDYDAAGVKCTAQGTGTLTFTCVTTPSSDLTVNVLIM